MGSRPDYHNTTNIGASIRVDNYLFNLPEEEFIDSMAKIAGEIAFQWLKEAKNERERKARTGRGLRVLPKNNIGNLGENSESGK